MSDIKIDSLKIEAKTNIKDAISDIEALKQALSGLGEGTSGVEQYQYAVNSLVQKLTKLNGIANKSGQEAVKKAVNDVAKAYMDFDAKSRNAAATQDEVDRALENVQEKISGVSHAIASNVREIREVSEESKKLVDYINGISGKIKIDPISIKSSFDPKDFAAMRSVLGKKFTSTGSGYEFESFINDMNDAIGTTFDTSKGLDTVFEELVKRMREIHNESRKLSTSEMLQRGLIPEKEIEAETSHFVAELDNLKNKFNLSEAQLLGGSSDQFLTMRDQLKSVTSAVNEKNKAFEKEQSIVSKASLSEIKDLINLKDKVDSLVQSVAGTNGLTSALSNLKNLGLSELASLKDIDFSGIAKLNQKTIQMATTQNPKGLSESEIAAIQKAADAAVAPESVPWFEDYQQLLQKARKESEQFLGSFYVPEEVDELKLEFNAIQDEILRLKETLQESLSTLDTDGVNQLVDDLANALAYAQDLSKAAQESNITLKTPERWSGPIATIPEELLDTSEIDQSLQNAADQIQSLQDTITQAAQNSNNAIRPVIRTEQEYKDALSNTAQEGRIFKDVIEQEIASIQKAPYSFSEFKSNLKEMIGVAGELIGKSQSLSKSISKIGSSVASASKKVTSLVKTLAKVSWEFLNFGSKKSALAGLKLPLTQSSKSLGDFNGKLKHGFQMLLRYGLGIRSLYVLFNKLRTGIKDGFNNLVLYSDKANKSISLLSSDMSYLGNSTASTFEPILNIVAPIIDQIVDYMVAGINSIGAFMAAITGQSSYTVAIKNIKDYRDSLNGAASAGDSAGDAVDGLKDKTKELEKEIMGFDEIEKFSKDLNDVANSGSDGGSGSGSGNKGGSEDPILFTKKDIPGAVSNFADLVKNAWEKADFTEIGNIVGTKLKNALDSIDWEPIKESANKIAKVTATFINGFFETAGLDESVGRTLGEAVNTGIGAINTFVDTTHWKSIGEFVSGGLRSAIDTIDWDGLGKTLNAKYKALWGFLDGFVVDMSTISFGGTTGWQEAGNALAETINSIFADRDYKAVGETIANGINGIVSTLDTAINGIDFSGIARNFANGINSIFYGVDFSAIGKTLADGFNQATSSLLTFSVTVDWKRIGRELAESANTFLAETDFSQAGKALGEAFKGALTAINEFAATFNWRSLGVDINNFIKGINWGGILKTSANIVANTFFGLFEAAWGFVFGGNDTKYTAIADNLNEAISKLNVEWPKFEQDELSNFNSAMDSLDKFWKINEKFKKNGSLSAQDESLFKFYYEQISKYAPDIAKEIGSIQTAYQGTKDTLEKLIETQKNAAIQKGFSSALEDASKIYGDAVVALEQLKTKFIDDSVSWKADILNGLLSRVDVYGGTIETWEKTFDKFLQKVRDGSIDFQNLTEDEEALWQVMREMNPQFGTMKESMESLNGTVETSGETVDKLQVAMGRYRDNTSSATTNTESLIQKLKGIKLTGVWKSLADELRDTLDSVTESLKSDKFTLGISNTLTDMFDKEFKVKLKVGGLDTSKLTEQDKTIQGASANVVSAKNALPEYMKSLDFTAALTQKKDSISDRTISDLKGSISQVSQTGGLTLDNIGAWIGYIGSKVQNLTLDNIGAWISNIGSQKPDLTLNNIGAWVSYIGSQTPNMTLNNIGAWISNIGSQISGMTLKDIGAWVSYIGSQNDGMTLNGIGAWISYIAQTGGLTLSNIGAWISNIAAQVGGLSLNGIGAWISYIAQTGGLSLSGILGYVNQVTRQPGISLILSGITAFISSVISGGGKAKGGAYYGGSWHTIAQFSSGGIITPNKMLNFNAVPKFAGGTLNAGSMFIAGEAGPELVGHVGGRTEVLNQSQLASVMETSVRSAIETVMSRYMSYGNGTVNVNVVLRGDAERIFEVVKAENNSRVMQTGRAQLLT